MRIIANTNCDAPTGSVKGIEVKGNPDFKYEWYKLPATKVHTSGSSSDLPDMEAGEFYLIVTDANNCKDTIGNFEIKPYDTPLVPAAKNNKAYCDGEKLEPITIDGTGGTYVWYNDENLTDTLFTGTVYLPTITKTDTLYVTETVHGCKSGIRKIIVQINSLPLADAGDEKHLLCSQSDVTLTGFGQGEHAISYSWKPASAIVSGAATSTPVVNAQGTYTLTVTDDSTGCQNFSQVNVIKDPIPVADFTPSVITGEDPLTVDFSNNSSGANSYEWIFGDEGTSNEKDPTFLFEKPVEYDVLLIASDNNKCPDTMRVRILVYEHFEITVPNVFTPNGDGVNDVFTINSSGIAELYGEIYDRWGLQLYSWDEKKGGWDGRLLSGLEVPDGVYYYIVRFKRQGYPETHHYKGSLLLFR